MITKEQLLDVEISIETDDDKWWWRITLRASVGPKAYGFAFASSGNRKFDTIVDAAKDAEEGLKKLMAEGEVIDETGN